MRDFLYIGSAPVEEDCVQVDPKVDYLPAMRAECERYMRALRHTLGPEPNGARLWIKQEQHDFGPYLSVCCYFDSDNEEAANYALRCEGKGPEYWPEGV